VYSRIINGEEYEFGVSGKLIRNALVMYDRQTNTLWSQLLGEAVSGPLAGTRLEYLPATMTTWDSWRQMHPDTDALQKGYVGSRDPYLGYYEGNSLGVLGVENVDDRIGVKQFVIGVEFDQTASAYPFSVLSEERIVNDEVAGIPIVVAFDPDSVAGGVWERTLKNGTLLEFAAVEGGFMRDTVTGSLWNGITGQAVEGDLAGEILVPVANTMVFWFAWVDFHPETALYGYQ
jgi:hypothetical protein